MRTSKQVLAALMALPLITNCSNNTATDQGSDLSLSSTSTQNAPITSQTENAEAYDVLTKILIRKSKRYWGDDKHAEQKEYVKYTNNYKTRVFINFEQGKVHIETLDQKDLHSAIISTLLTPDNPEQVDLFTDQGIPLGEEPMLYGQVLDQNGRPIRWQWGAKYFADYLLANCLEQKNSPKGKIYSVSIDLVKDHTLKRQYQYAGIIRQYGHFYNIDESLIYAIIHTESRFNPYAISNANAYGLMQVIPSSAGKDVFKRVKNRRDDLPSKEYLFKPQNNIEIGTAYLHLLDNHYLKDIEDPLSRKYSMISAYNGGTGSVLATFDKSRKRALAKINSMAPEEVYQALTTNHPRAESRQYLKKVTLAQKAFYQFYASSG